MATDCIPQVTFEGEGFPKPVVAAVTFDAEREQFAVAAVLHPGNARAGLGARALLRQVLTKLRRAFPTATFRVRLDRGFASAKMFAFLEREAVVYVVAMAATRAWTSGPPADGQGAGDPVAP
jgi:hypothetical protein